MCTSELCIFGLHHLSFISTFCSSRVYPRFPIIHSACVFCLCSCHVWYNQLYRCRVNQSRMKIKAHLLPLSFSSWDEPRIEGRVSECVCVLAAGASMCVCARSQRCIWPLSPGLRCSTLPHLAIFSMAGVHSSVGEPKTRDMTLDYLIKHLWNMTWETRKVKAVPATPVGDFSENIHASLWAEAHH